MEEPKSDIIASSAALCEAIAKNLRGPKPDLSTAAQAAAQLVANLTFTNGATQTTYVLRSKVEDVCERPACTEKRVYSGATGPSPTTGRDQPQPAKSNSQEEKLATITREAAEAYRLEAACNIEARRLNLKRHRLNEEAEAILATEHKAQGGT